MVGIFGFFSPQSNSKRIKNILLQNICRERGRVTDSFGDHNFCVMVQSHLSANWVIEEKTAKDIECSSSISDFPPDNQKSALRVLEHMYLRISQQPAHLQPPFSEQAWRFLFDDGLFVLYDKRHRRLLLLCDPFGIRKIYYCVCSGVLFFSSSFSQILRTLIEWAAFGRALNDELDLEAIRTFVMCGICPIGGTIFTKISKTIPGEMLLFQLDATSVERRVVFWDQAPSQKAHDEDVVNITHSLLEESVRERISNRAVDGILLSGGLDSGMIAAYLSSLKSRSKIFPVAISYEEEDWRLAQVVADYLGIGLTVRRVGLDEQNLFRSFEESISCVEEPCTIGSMVSRYLGLSELKRDCGKVFLGEGGDELFLGYEVSTWYSGDAMSWLPNKNRLLRALGLLERCSLQLPRDCFGGLVNTKAPSWILDLDHYLDNSLLGKLQSLAMRTRFELSILSLLGKRRRMDEPTRIAFLKTFLLTQSDVMVDENIASRLGLRIALPFLDADLSRRVNSFPTSEKLRNGVTKYVLRQVAERHNMLPREIVEMRKKVGFSEAPFLRGEVGMKMAMERIKSSSDNLHMSTIEKLVKAMEENRGGRGRELLYKMLVLTEVLSNSLQT